MECRILVTDDFEAWWHTLAGNERIDLLAGINLLRAKGPILRFPYSSGIEGSKYTHMRELRIQHEGRPYRILYAFDPQRAALLLIGGDKTGNDRWYQEYIPIADRLCAAHLETLNQKQTKETFHGKTF